MGWLDNILGKKEEPKKEKKKSTKKTATKKAEPKKESKKETKKEIVAKGPEKKKAEPKSKWTKGKLDKLSKQELYAIARDLNVKTDGLSKTQIQSLIAKG